MDDLPLEKITISGPTLASMIQRFSSSPGDVDGLLFGHVTQPTSSTLLDDSSTTTTTTTYIATITNLICFSTISTFYDSLGRLNVPTLLRHSLESRPSSLIGWFVARRRTPLRPSMRDFSVSSSLSSETLISPNPNFNFSPCVLIMLSTPQTDQTIHTHEHRAFQFRRTSGGGGVFEPKSMDVINIGPAFRGHYGAFSPNSPFPWLDCPVRDASEIEMEEEEEEEERGRESLSKSKRVAKEQKALDFCADGFEVGRLSKLMGSEAANYTSELEDLYGKMLSKLDGLARAVENSSAKVLEQVRKRLETMGLVLIPMFELYFLLSNPNGATEYEIKEQIGGLGVIVGSLHSCFETVQNRNGCC